MVERTFHSFEMNVAEYQKTKRLYKYIEGIDT